MDGQTGALRVAQNLSFSVSHRHFSHLFPCWPLGLLNASDPRCMKAADQWYHAAMAGPWTTPSTSGDWCLWSMAVLSSLSTLMGRREESWSNLTAAAYRHVMPSMTPFGSALLSNSMCKRTRRSLLQLLSPVTFGWASTDGEGCNNENGNSEVGKQGPCGDPTGETPFAIASALQDSMLVTDRAAGHVRVFAGVPASAPPMSFHELLAEGGFLISAARKHGVTSFVHIRSTATGHSQLRIDPGLGPGGVAAQCDGSPCGDSALQHADGTVTVSFAAANTTALLLPAGGSAAAAVVKPAAPEAEYENWWGCKEGKSAGH